MPGRLKIGVTFLRCAEITSGNPTSLGQYLKTRGAKVEAWDADSKSDPLVAFRDEDIGSHGFQAWIGKDAFSISVIPRLGTLLVTAEMLSGDRPRRLQQLQAFADELFVVVKGRFGYADLHGDLPAGLSRAVTSLQIRWLFWRNYFGREYVKALGTEFFEQAPFSSISRLSDTALRCDLRERPDEATPAARKAALKAYFESSGPCEIYEAKDFRIEF
jgi:hypothetical protein